MWKYLDIARWIQAFPSFHFRSQLHGWLLTQWLLAVACQITQGSGLAWEGSADFRWSSQYGGVWLEPEVSGAGKRLLMSQVDGWALPTRSRGRLQHGPHELLPSRMETAASWGAVNWKRCEGTGDLFYSDLRITTGKMSIFPSSWASLENEKEGRQHFHFQEHHSSFPWRSAACYI